MRELTAIILTALIVCPRVSVGHTFTGRVERVIDPPQSAAAESRRVGGDNTFCFTGMVERVIDGDTICLRAEGEHLTRADLDRHGLVHVRLAEIDAPELKEPGGPAAREALSDMILGKTVRVEWRHRGRYRRIIGRVYFCAQSINRVLFVEGLVSRWPPPEPIHPRTSHTNQRNRGERKSGYDNLPGATRKGIQMAHAQSEPRHASEASALTAGSATLVVHNRMGK